ncbi:phosphotriesterase family protein [Microbacterium thalassium]|uniref:Phosphotriesterase-related protein n=1 Tax=Microbacterium thalassium TaxID=362649 RepID=A0A7X0KTY7_9MICO|nr:phosphotriesterase-related protein [Microbacterium thalassium]MBB6390602.1 phosphotriesterase-related protein [Microbacterium thalassium]GLK25712.1 phosphotriesterase [Microbacterium thalassium]
MSEASTPGVPTFTGQVDAGALGVTLIHEHVFVRSPELDASMPHPEWDEDALVDRAVGLFQRLHEHGVRTVVDLTVPGLGRDVRTVARVAERVPVSLIAATGWYTADVLPHAIRMNGPGRLVDGPDPLIELFVGDIERGIAGTGIRAGMLKVVSDAEGITPDVERVFTAAAVAHAQTGVPITTHSHAPSRGGLAQQRLLSGLGVRLDRVVIGHSGDSTDLAYLRELADAGSYLGFDRFGMSHVGSDEDRVRMLLALLEAGYGDRIVLSHDAAVFSRVTPPSWRAGTVPQWRMDHLFTTILPRLAREGVDERTIAQLMVDNPRRLLAAERSTDLPRPEHAPPVGWGT